MNRKATWVWADALYWFFYLPLTVVIIVALVVVPSSILNSSVQPTNLDATIMRERMEQKLTPYSSETGTEKDFLISNPEKALFTLSLPGEHKKFGAKIKISTNNYYINKPFYDDAVHLAGIGYKRYETSEFRITKEGITGFGIDQVFAPRYEQ